MLERAAEPGPERALLPLNSPSVSIYFTRANAAGPLYGLVLQHYLVGSVRARHGMLGVEQHRHYVEVGGMISGGGLFGSVGKILLIYSKQVS